MSLILKSQPSSNSRSFGAKLFTLRLKTLGDGVMVSYGVTVRKIPFFFEIFVGVKAETPVQSFILNAIWWFVVRGSWFVVRTMHIAANYEMSWTPKSAHK